MKPITKYTKSGKVNIAYQVFGSGPMDLVYIPGWISNIDCVWTCPELVYFLQELGKVARVILFDKRGTGLSDRVLEFPTLEERMDDIRAVMDAAGSEKAVLFGHSEGGSVSALFAATYPQRTISLIAFGIFAKRIYTPDYPWAPTNEERQVVYDMIENNWGSGDMKLESLAPSKADDPVFMDWLATYFRSGASPSAAMMLTKMNTEVDIIDILDSINVPTLLLQRTHDVDVKIEEGRFIAARIPGAKLVELDGSDHLFWTGNTDLILKEMKRFVLHEIPEPVYEKQLFTIVVGRIIDSETNNPKYQECITEYAEKYRGNIAQYNAQMFIATFDGPSRAVQCSIGMIEAIRGLHADLAIGVHIKECQVGGVISNEIEDFTTLLHKEGIAGQILLTRTVKNLLVGAGVNCIPCDVIFEPKSCKPMVLFRVAEPLNRNHSKSLKNQTLPHNNSFLEKVLQHIENHLGNDYFGVKMLCREIGVSERQLQRKLKEVINKSPNQLISSVRLHHAKELILNQHTTIAEIAYQTGFSDPSYFSKCFKREFAVSPSELMSL